jgi:urease accessory protein
MTEQLRIFTEHVPARRTTAADTEPTELKLVLPFEQRQKARQRVRAAGVDVGIQLPRGTVLRGGDRLRAPDGAELEIVAARERVSTVYCRDLRRLAQVAYHLGNRHVALEIGTGWVRYLADHVLDVLVSQLGLKVVHEDEPFEPEAGAYGGHGHAHGPHDGNGAHSHAHSHEHGHRLAFGGALHHHQHHHDREP